MNISILEINFDDNQRMFPAVYFYLKSYYTKYGTQKDNVNWVRFPFITNITSDTVVDFIKHNDIQLLLCSVYTWNHHTMTGVIQKVKQQTDCKILFGGPHVMTMYHRQKYFQDYPFIDIACIGDGENAVADLLDALAINGTDYKKKIVGISYKNDEENSSYIPSRCNEISEVSPYFDLADEFQEVCDEFDTYCKQENFTKAIVLDSNRGCPYRCTFCDWGISTMTKVLKRNQEKFLKELDLILRNNFHNIILGDANFGLYDLDLEVTKRISNYRIQHGFPKNMSVSFAKTNKVMDRLMEIHRLGHESKILPFFLIHMQDSDKKVLEIIKRKNLSIDDFKRIKDHVSQTGMLTKSQMILGMPGQNKETVLGSAFTLTEMGLTNNYTNLLIDLPGAEMSSPVYRKKYKMQSQNLVMDDASIPSIRAIDDIEYKRLAEVEIPCFPPKIEQKQRYVTNTFSFTKEEYSEMIVLNHLMTVFENNWFLKVVRIMAGKHGLSIKDFYKNVIDEMQSGLPTVYKHVYKGKKQITAWLNGNDSFKIRSDSDTDNLRFDMNFQNYMLLALLVEKEKYLKELKNFLEGKIPGNTIKDALQLTDLMLVADGRKEKHSKTITVQGKEFARVIDPQFHIWQDHDEHTRSLFLSTCYDQRRSLNVYQQYTYNGKPIDLNQMAHFIDEFHLTKNTT
jgi:putative methyltransferase